VSEFGEKMKATLLRGLAVSLFLCLVIATAQPAHAQAQTVTLRQALPVSGELTTCSGTDVTVNGTANVIIHETANAAGGFNLNVLISGQLSGVDEAGNNYNGAIESSETLNVNAGGEESQVITLVLSGPAGQFRVHVTTHITVDANGNVTAYVDNVSSDC
jgi:hypothetical protein